jgi:hypothetical protein
MRTGCKLDTFGSGPKSNRQEHLLYQNTNTIIFRHKESQCRQEFISTGKNYQRA